MYSFTPAISFFVTCKDQEEVDYYWSRFLEGGKEQQCGWIQDKFGVCWQIIPDALMRCLGDPDQEKRARCTAAMMKMVKISVAELEKAYEG